MFNLSYINNMYVCKVCGYRLYKKARIFINKELFFISNFLLLHLIKYFTSSQEGSFCDIQFNSHKEFLRKELSALDRFKFEFKVFV